MTVEPLKIENKSPPFGEGDGNGEPVGEGFGEPVGLGFGEPVGDALGDGFGEPLGEADGDGLGFTIPNVPAKMLFVPCLTVIGIPLLTFGTL